MKLAVLLLSLFFCMSSKAQTNQEKAIAAIKAARLASNAAIAKHDIAGIAKHWLDEFVVTTGNGSVITGKDAAIAVFKRLFERSAELVYIRTPQNIIISDSDTLAFETGQWKGCNVEGEHLTIGGSYSAMWWKREDEWKIRSELFVTLTHW